MIKKKGISLIALLITVVVIIIIAGVVINEVRGNGIIARAKEAVNLYGQATGKEKTEIDKISGDGTKDGENDPNHEIDEVEIDDSLQKYVLGSNKKGRNLMEIMTFDSRRNPVFSDDPSTEEDESQIQMFGTNMINDFDDDPTTNVVNTTEAYVIYNGKRYAVTYDSNFNSKKIETISGREGEDLGEVTGDSQYNGWIILYDNGDTVEAISPTTKGSVTLGAHYTDTEAAIVSYNNAIKTLNDTCKSLERLPANIGVRSVGAKTDPTSTMYNGIPSSWAISNYNGRLKDKDTAYKEDYKRIMLCGANINESYWIASRMIMTENFTNNNSGIEIHFNIVFVSNGLYMTTPYNMAQVYCYSNQEQILCGEKTHPVRPIITVKVN